MKLRVQTHEDGSFAYAADGHLATILPVPGLDGIMEDIVCWRDDDPYRWWLRRQVAVILGMAAVEAADYLRQPLFLHETPFDWLKAGGTGAVVLNWDAHMPAHLPWNVTIRCATPRLARKIRKALAPPTPQVEVSYG